MKKILYKSENILVEADEAHRYFSITANGTVGLNEYKSGFTAMGDAAEADLPFNKLLLDIKDLKSTPQMGRAWLATSFAPRFYKTCNKDVKTAIILPDNTFERLTVKVVISSFQVAGIHIDPFLTENKEEALEWISKK